MPSTRNAFWLAVLCLVLGAWGWDRGRLAARLETPSDARMYDYDYPLIPAMGAAPLPLDSAEISK